ncbi:MAG TPA: glycosyltransferase family 4 protein [Caproiciproducens sp.]|nr:glycosyltransferase family 4 protein [Caproiciproducens sp.]
MKKILFLTSRLPFPATSGRKASLYQYGQVLKELGFELVVASFLEQGDEPSQVPAFIDKLVVLPPVRKLSKIKNLIFKTCLTGRFPMQVSLFWSRKANAVIRELIRHEQPDIVIADMVRMTEYLKTADCVKIADLDDLLSIRYQRQLKMDLSQINPYGAYLSSLPKPVQKVLMNITIKRKVLKRETNLLQKYELETGKFCSAVVFVAKREAEVYNKLLGRDKAFAVPIGVDTEYFAGPAANLSMDKNKIAFLGALNVAHNETAVIHFVRDIFPLILKRKPDAEYVVVGSGITDKLKKLASPNVIFTGRVDDVREYIKQCRVFVCPLTFGSGIKTKNLEAMAMGVALVTSSIGAENIDGIDGADYLVADRDEDFAEAVIKVLDDDALCSSLSKNGEQFVKNCFSLERTKMDFSRLFKILAESCTFTVMTDGKPAGNS